MQILAPHPRPTETETEGGAHCCVLTSPPGDCPDHSLRTTSPNRSLRKRAQGRVPRAPPPGPSHVRGHQGEHAAKTHKVKEQLGKGASLRADKWEVMSRWKQGGEMTSRKDSREAVPAKGSNRRNRDAIWFPRLSVEFHCGRNILVTELP